MNEAAARIVRRFGLVPHPEGGFFKEVHRSEISLRYSGAPGRTGATRCAGTLIYFLLPHGQFSAFHRVRSADEIWHLYAGGPLELHLIDRDGTYANRVLTTDLDAGEPAAVVPAEWWQAARLAPGAAWAFSGCTVAPGFEFADFEMPPRDALVAAYPAHERIVRELTRP